MNIMREAELASREIDFEIAKEDVDCNLCGSNGRRLLRGAVPRIPPAMECSIVACTTCGHRYLNPRPVESELVIIRPTTTRTTTRPAGAARRSLW